MKDDLSSVFAYHTTSKSTFFKIKKHIFICHVENKQC